MTWLGQRDLWLKIAVAIFVYLHLSGCILALGAAAGAGGYEVHQASEMEDLEADYKAGRISKEEYEARRQQIDDTSLFQ